MKTYVLLIIFLPILCWADNYSKEEVEIMRNIKCPVCNGQSIYDSNNEVSMQMRKIVTSLIVQHKNKIEIEEFFQSEFGDEIILNSKKSNILLAIYLLPLFIMLLFIWMFLFK
jgi:cytochrome c-type biogenesis protein CcmH